jgi:hypothetical protein
MRCGTALASEGAVEGVASRGSCQGRSTVPEPPLTRHWSRRPIASAPTSLQLSGAAHRQRSPHERTVADVLAEAIPSGSEEA